MMSDRKPEIAPWQNGSRSAVSAVAGQPDALLNIRGQQHFHATGDMCIPSVL